MTDLRLTLACWDYDRTRALIDGRVSLPGCTIKPTVLPPGEIFARAFTEAPFDISELSLSSYMMQASRGESAYVAVPAFVSRAFRHGGLYVRAESGIRAPKDLEGRLVGVPEYQMTMALWARGLLQDEYGVDFRKLRYRTGGTNTPGRVERLELALPDDMDVAPIDPARTLNELLAAGEIDAVMAPSPPRAFIDGDGTIRRLIDDAAATERAYFEKTRIFPIMHVIGLRKSLADAHPGLAGAVFQAFVEARALAMAEMRVTATAGANRIGLPWFGAEWEATRMLMGDDFWTYGVDANRADLEAACRYSHEQYLSESRLAAEDLFAPETVFLPGS